MTQMATRPRPQQTGLAAGNFDVDAIERIVIDTVVALDDAAGKFAKAFAMASGIQQLRQLITVPMMSVIMPLQGTSLGFRTDKDREGGYREDVVKECLIEAVLRGANVVGNEFNIIAGRTYLTKEFFQRATGQLEGVSDLKLHPGLPRISPAGAVVPFKVTWKKFGKSDEVVRDIAVKVNSGMGADAIIGKATRKALKAAYEQITGSTTLPDGDIDDGSTGTTSATSGSRTESVAAKLAKQVTAKPVSENQTFVPDENAEQSVAAQDAVVGETFDRETGEVAEQPEPPDLSSHEALVEAMEQISRDRDMKPSAVGEWWAAYSLAKGVKGKEAKMTPAQRSEALAAFAGAN